METRIRIIIQRREVSAKSMHAWKKWVRVAIKVSVAFETELTNSDDEGQTGEFSTLLPRRELELWNFEGRCRLRRKMWRVLLLSRGEQESRTKVATTSCERRPRHNFLWTKTAITNFNIETLRATISRDNFASESRGHGQKVFAITNGLWSEMNHEHKSWSTMKSGPAKMMTSWRSQFDSRAWCRLWYQVKNYTVLLSSLGFLNYMYN